MSPWPHIFAGGGFSLIAETLPELAPEIRAPLLVIGGLMLCYGVILLIRERFGLVGPVLWGTKRSSGIRMPLTELRDLAAYSGWEALNSDSYNILEFTKGLRQAGLDGELRFWGRPHLFRDINRHEPLHEISKGHWSKFQIDSTDLIQATGNIDARTYTPGDSVKGYIDLHVHRRPAHRWLRKKAKTYKGTYRR